MCIYSLVVEIRSSIDFRYEATPQVFMSESEAMQGVYDFLADSVQSNDILTDHLAELSQPLAEKLYSIKHEGLEFNRESMVRLDKVEWDLVIDFFCDFHNSESSETFFYYNITKHEGIESRSSVTTILDTEIKDWRFSEGEEVPASEKTPYRLIVEYSSTGKLYARCYPSIIDQIDSDTLIESGIAVALEIRKGKPALSLGLDESNECIFIESDYNSKIALEKEHHYFGSEKHLFELCDGRTILEIRELIAKKAYQEHIDQLDNFEADSGAEFDGSTYKRTYFVDEGGEATVKKVFTWIAIQINELRYQQIGMAVFLLSITFYFYSLGEWFWSVVL